MGMEGGCERVFGATSAALSTPRFSACYLMLVPMMSLGMLVVSQQWQASDVFRLAPAIGPAAIACVLGRARRPLTARRSEDHFYPGAYPGNGMAHDISPVQGTLDGIILKTLSWGPRHGYGIARWIRQTSGNSLTIEDRALYLALHRLEEREWVESEWGYSENQRRAKYYRLTPAGRRHLRAEHERLTEYANAIQRVFAAKAWEPKA